MSIEDKNISKTAEKYHIFIIFSTFTELNILTMFIPDYGLLISIQIDNFKTFVCFNIKVVFQDHETRNMSHGVNVGQYT